MVMLEEYQIGIDLKIISHVQKDTHTEVWVTAGIKTTRNTRYTDTDILNKKIGLIYKYLPFKDMYLKDSVQRQ